MRPAAPAVLAALCALMLWAPAANATQRVTFTPEADAWVSDDAPDANHGSDTSLQVRSSPPVTHTYLRFRAPTGAIPPGAVITRTILRLHSPANVTGKVQVRMPDQTTGNSWGENTI